MLRHRSLASRLHRAAGSAVGPDTRVQPRSVRVRGTLIAIVAALALTAGVPVPGLNAASTASATEGDFAAMRERWVTYMLGSEPDLSDPDVQAFVNGRTSAAQSAWSSMETSAERTYLWSDLSDFTTTAAGGSIIDSFARLRAMAYAYRGAGALQGDPALRDAILDGTDWLLDHYSTTASETGNWWNWEIGTPRRLGDLLVLMHDDLSPELRQRAIASIDRWCGDPTRRTQYTNVIEEGANRSDKALNVLLRGIVTDNAAKVLVARDALDQVYPYVTSGNGFYEDGSFVFHGSVAYTGGYGPPLLESVAGSFYLLASTEFDVTNPLASNVHAWLEDAFIPLVYRGAMMDMVRGRKITRENETDHHAGAGVAGSLALFAEFASPARAVTYKRQIKTWMESDPNTRYVYGTSLYITQLLKAIESDPAISPLQQKPSSAVYAGMGRAVQTGSDFAIGISAFSHRISSFTSGNGENLNGWWQGAGTTLIYAGDSYEFDNNYWATVDMRRLPGTTTDGSGSGTPGAFAAYPNTSSWAGGSTVDGRYGAFGLDFTMRDVTGSDLAGKKSWFMLGDRLVALGTGISGSGTVETVVDDRLTSGAAGAVKLDGIGVANGSQGVTANASYGYIAGADQENSVGYVFLGNPGVKALNETRQGTWAAQSTGGSTTVRTNHHGSLAIQHGTGPTGGSYQYAVLPGRSEAQTASAAGSLGVDVLRNDSVAQAVSDGRSGVVSANFFTDETASVDLDDAPILTSDRKSSVTTRVTDTEISIGVSDPTQKNTGRIHVELNRPAYGVLEVDPGVTVTQLEPTVKLTVDVAHQPGRTFRVRLDAEAPERPGQPQLQAAPHNGYVALTWNHVGDESGYVLRYGTRPTDLSEAITVGTVTAVNRLNVPNLSNGTTYYFSVTAVGGESQGKKSSVVAATPADFPNVPVVSPATEDAFVRDGTTYENTNYGSLDRLEIKADGPVGGGFNRSAYVKFDISQVLDRVDSAKITLQSTSGPAGTTNQVRAVATDATWSEASVTYATRPASAASGVSFPSPAVGQTVDVDVTAAVRAALAAGESTVSLQILSPFGQGSGAQVNYASSENANEAARPRLAINGGAVPVAPQVTVGALTPTSVTLKWPYVGGAQRFVVTHSAAGAEPVTLDVAASTTAAQDASNSLQVQGLSEGTEYTFTVTAVAGAHSATSAEVTATPHLTANPAVSLPSAGDSYVRDGASNADLSFGTVSSMTVKNDATGYTRHSYVRFDLASVTGRIDVARLRLVPASVGMAGVTHAAAAIADASWGETTLTWNNRPVPAAATSTWTVPAAGTAVEIDLTDQVQAAKAAGATSVTFVITQTANQGASSTVSYATKESGTVANRPLLKIN